MYKKNSQRAYTLLLTFLSIFFLPQTQCMKNCASYTEIEMAIFQQSRIDDEFDSPIETDNEGCFKCPTLHELDKQLKNLCRNTAYAQNVSMLTQTEDVLAQDKNGKTRLHYAVYMWDYDLIANLLAYKNEKSTANVQDIAGETPLHALIMRDPLTGAQAEKTLLLLGLAHLNGAQFGIANNEGETLLHHAVRYQVYNDRCTEIRKRILETLVARGIDVNQPTTLTGQTPLHYAVKNYCSNNYLASTLRLEMIPTLLALGADPAQADALDKNTSLHHIVSNRCLEDSLELSEIVALLLKNPNRVVVKNPDRTVGDADPNAVNFFGYTPLHIVMHARPNTTMQGCAVLLLNQGANPNIVSQDGYAPLHIAVCNKQIDWVKLLVSHSSTDCCVVRAPLKPLKKLEAISRETGIPASYEPPFIELETPLDMAHKLYDSIVDLDSQQDTSDNSSCQTSTDEDSSDEDDFGAWDRLKRAKSPNAKKNDLEKATALSSHELSQIIHILERKATDYINRRLITSAEKTPFWFAVSVFSMFPELNAQDTDGNTRLHYAAQILDVELVKKILRMARNEPLTRIKNKKGETPLLSLLRYCLEERRCDNSLVYTIMNVLTEDNAVVNDPNNDGETALHYIARYKSAINACCQSRVQILKALIEKYATIDAATTFGETPLHFVFKYNNLDGAQGEESLLSLLLRNQADPIAKTDNGDTPLHYAVSYRCATDQLTQRKSAIEQLVASGAQINALNKGLDTPLHTIFKPFCYKDSDLPNTGNLSKEDLDAQNAVFMPTFDRLPYVKLLLMLGANPNVQDAMGNTLLHNVMHMRCTDSLHMVVAHFLKFYNANPTIANKAGHTPLHIATCKEQTRWVQLLLEQPNVSAVARYPATFTRASRPAYSNTSALDLALELRTLRMYPTYKDILTRNKLESVDRMNQGSLLHIIDLLKQHAVLELSEQAICKRLLFLVLLSSSSVSL